MFNQFKKKYLFSILALFLTFFICYAGFLGDFGKPIRSFSKSFMGDIASFSGIGGFVSTSFG